MANLNRTELVLQSHLSVPQQWTSLADADYEMDGNSRRYEMAQWQQVCLRDLRMHDWMVWCEVDIDGSFRTGRSHQPSVVMLAKIVPNSGLHAFILDKHSHNLYNPPPSIEVQLIHSWRANVCFQTVSFLWTIALLGVLITLLSTNFMWQH